jgi:hypothetical protein
MVNYLKNKRRMERMAKFIVESSDSEDDKERKLKPRPPVNKNIDTYDYAEPSYLDDVAFDFKQFGTDDTYL